MRSFYHVSSLHICLFCLKHQSFFCVVKLILLVLTIFYIMKVKTHSLYICPNILSMWWSDDLVDLLVKTHSISSGPHIIAMWWPDDLVNLLILLFDFITKPYWLDTWYLHPIMLCDPMLNYVTSFGPAVSY